MNWNQLISAKRFGMEEFHEERQENRSEFQRDYDRLIFSAPFRRLQNKTQVFPLPQGLQLRALQPATAKRGILHAVATLYKMQ